MCGVQGVLFQVLILAVCWTNISAKLSITSALNISCDNPGNKDVQIAMLAVQTEAETIPIYNLMRKDNLGDNVLEFCCELSGIVKFIWMPFRTNTAASSFNHDCCVNLTKTTLVKNSDIPVVIGGEQLCPNNKAMHSGTSVELCSDRDDGDRRLELAFNASAEFQGSIVLQDCNVTLDGVLNGNCSIGLCNSINSSVSSIPVSAASLSSTRSLLPSSFTSSFFVGSTANFNSSTADILMSSVSTITPTMTSSLEIDFTSTMNQVTSLSMQNEMTSLSLSEIESTTSQLLSPEMLYTMSLIMISSTRSASVVSPMETILTSSLSTAPLPILISGTFTHHQPDSITTATVAPSSSNDFISSSVANNFSVSVTLSFPTSSLLATSLTSSFFVGSFSSISPSPFPIACPLDGIWPETVVNTNASGSCFKGAVRGTRRCSSDSSWYDPYCESPQSFLDILTKTQNSPETALQLLKSELMNNSSQLTLYQEAFLLFNIYQTQVDSTLKQVSVNFSRDFLDVASELVTVDQDLPDNNEERRNIGSTVLQTLDEFVLELLDSNTTNISTENIVLTTLEMQQPTEPVTSIYVETNRISIPGEVFANPSNEAVRVVSFYYQNLSLLLLPKMYTSIASSVISSTTDCGSCSTQKLRTNVTISFNLTTKNMPRQGYNDTLICVFWEFAEVDKDEPFTGSWSEDGCYLMEHEGEAVVCGCNHLTHFAILLSPGVEISSIQQKLLTYIGYAVIPISLVALLLTIFTFIFFRSLWSMRNYIHIMLCANLFAGQLLFVVGIEQTDNQAVCTGISVVLQYLFLVTFMWMLMEGVVLYVSLVRVFVAHIKCYIIAFTVASYGIPALYLSVIVPIGFTVANSNTNLTGSSNSYLLFVDNQLVACWLSYDNGFIWTFIAPVISIILVNVGFLIMALIIIYRHRRKKSDEKQIEVAKYWIKACISLVVVMGIAWLFNVLFFIKELIFIAYVMTIFISSQGVIIFFLFVVLSKQSREAYAIWWHNKVIKSELHSSITPSSNKRTEPCDILEEHKVDKKNPASTDNDHENDCIEWKLKSPIGNNIHGIEKNGQLDTSFLENTAAVVQHNDF